ncbi:ABC transporter substrate-binding protein [Oceaniglobus trochenteri]|uniref:ABC transporter substrate-binding protein n=1 Tax=Oceaniglobus trochenteri TaxID=2763260 RepID=UPI001CFFF140|nr:sugar ABC transporter substrate-binding protein [Oceaniglobus trochenteri]
MKHTCRLALASAMALTLGSPAMADTVDFMSWTYTEDSGKATIEKLIEDYQAQSENDVNPIGYAWSDMIKNTFLRARTNTLPDLSQVQARLLPTVANIDGIVDLNDVFGADKLEQMFPAGFLAMGQIDGKQVALPFIAGTIGMVANRKVLDAAGIDEIPETMEQFRDALVKVRDNVPNSVPYGMATKNNASILLDYMIWMWTFGGDIIVDGQPAVNTPEGVAALEFMVGLMNDRLAAPEIDRPDARRLFGQEATAFYFDAPSAKKFAADFSGQGDAYTVNVMPMATPVTEAGGTPASIQWGHVLAMFGDENAKPDSAASEFLMYILSDDVIVPYALGSGAIPPTTTGSNSDAVQNDPYLAAWSAAAVAPRRNTIASLENGAAINDIIGEEVQSALLGQKSAQDAADDMQGRLAEALK